MVYFIEALETKQCKIGYTGGPSVKTRLRQLQTGCAQTLKVRATIPDGNIDVERSLHKRFEHLRLKREWFEFGVDIKNYVAWINRSSPSGLARRERVLSDNGIPSDKIHHYIMSKTGKNDRESITPRQLERVISNLECSLERGGAAAVVCDMDHHFWTLFSSDFIFTKAIHKYKRAEDLDMTLEEVREKYYDEFKEETIMAWARQEAYRNV